MDRSCSDLQLTEEGSFMDNFLLLPTEMKAKILSYLSLYEMLNLRLVSCQWKGIISNYFTNFSCHLTDESYPYLVNATECFRTLKVSNLTRPRNMVISSTRGTVSKVIASVECLHLVGENIDRGELKKIIPYPENIYEVIFENSKIPILTATLGTKWNAFRSLAKLTIEFKQRPTQKQNAFLTKLAALSSSLPLVSHLGLHWKNSDGFLLAPAGLSCAISAINTYVVAIRVVLSLQKSLKSLEITRESRINYFMSQAFNDAMSGQNSRLLLQQDLVPESLNKTVVLANQYEEELGYLKLERLKLTLLKMEGSRPFVLENAILRYQPCLKELSVERHERSRIRSRQTLLTLLPETPPRFLTSVTILFSKQAIGPLPLGYFSQCVLLKKLVIGCYCNPYIFDRELTCQLDDFEQLPKSLEELRLIPTRPHVSMLAEIYMVLTKTQLNWMVEGGLPNLQSLGVFLTSAVTTRPPPGMDSALENLDMGLFRKLVEMPQVKRLELNMATTGQIRGFPTLFRNQYYAWTHDYLRVCRANMGYHLRTRRAPYNYLEVTIEKYRW